jgi:hypothetical protein
MKLIRIFLLVLIIIGIGLLITQKIWVPKVVAEILSYQDGSETNIINAPNWKSYQNSQIGLQIDYPSNWFIQDENDTEGILTFASSPKAQNLNGPGIPPLGNQWVEIAKGICNDQTANFVSEAPDLDISEKTICQNGFQITLGLWNEDGQFASHKQLLQEIANSLQLYK